MGKRTYVIIGATGHIGHVAALELLKMGHTVKALGRNNEKLHQLEEEGAETVFLKDFDQAKALADISEGADAVFSFIPPAYEQTDFAAYQKRVGEAIVKGLERAKVNYVVNLSSVGADLAQGTGPIKGLHDQEERLNTLEDVQVLHLRPCFFMENFYHLIPLLKMQGRFGMALKGEVPIEMVATQDIGVKAAQFLDKLDFKGKTIFEYYGPKTYTLKEAARILGKEIGKDQLEYTQFSYEEVEKGLLFMGMQPSSARLMIEMYHAFNEGKVKINKNLPQEHRGKTTLQQFSKDFALAYRNYKERSVASKSR